MRLVKTQKKPCAKEKLERKILEFYEDFFVSKREKVYVLKDIITRIYRDYEISTGINDIPYFIKSENKIREIVAEGSVEYYYKKLKKFRRDGNYGLRKIQ